jgi:hypothetical protein
MAKRTKAELLAWIEQHQPVTREKLLGAFEDMDYEQLQRWLSTHVRNYGDVFRQAAGARRLTGILVRYVTVSPNSCT